MSKLGLTAFAAFFMASASLAQTAEDLSDLVGARAAGGETQLEARGYRFITTNMVRDTKWAFWYSDRNRQCVQVATSDGRYNAVNRVPEANCRQQAAQVPESGYGQLRPNEGSYGAGNGYDRPDARRDDALTLICYGQGTGPSTQSYSGYHYNSDTKRYEPEFGNRSVREGFSSDVQVEIRQGLGRIHLGGKLVSPIHSGGTDGWWPIDELVVSPERITGHYRLNGLNKPRLDIDRGTGTIQILATTNFTGRCDVGNWGRRF